MGYIGPMPMQSEMYRGYELKILLPVPGKRRPYEKRMVV
jgi:hypothetical protein